MILQQLGGPNLIGYYATLLYTQSLGMSEHQAALTSGGSFLVMWAGTLACLLAIERVGRRKLFILGGMSQLIFMALFTAGLGVATKSSQRMSIVCIFLYNFCFGGRVSASAATIVNIEEDLKDADDNRSDEDSGKRG